MRTLDEIVALAAELYRVGIDVIEEADEAARLRGCISDEAARLAAPCTYKDRMASVDRLRLLASAAGEIETR